MKTPYQQSLTQADVAALCTAAHHAWLAASDRARIVRFTWRRKRFCSTLTSFRMLIDTADGEPVACRYHQW
jgi:hypothetical protein